LKAGEFFIELGIKGHEKTISSLSKAKSLIGELGSTSLEAKAAILATAYAFERMMSSSARTGTEMTNFSNFTGISVKTLQQYQYAAAQVGVSNEEIASSFKSVQNIMTSMRFGKGAPEGLAMMMEVLQRGGSNFDPNRAKTDIEYVMRKLQEYANLEKDISKRNLVMKSFGLGEGVVAGMARNAFRPEIFSKAPMFTDKETNQLDKVNAAFSNLSIKIKMAAWHFTAIHGAQLVKDFTFMADGVIKLANAFEKLSTKLKLFETAGHMLEGISNIFKITGEIIDKVQGKELKKGDILHLEPNQEMVPGVSGPISKFFGDLISQVMPKKAEPAPAYTGKIPLPATTGPAPVIKNTLPAQHYLASNKKPVENKIYVQPAESKPSRAIATPSIAAPLKSNAAAPATSNAQVKPAINVSPIVSPQLKVAPAISPLATAPNSSTQNNNVNQTFNFQNDGSDHKQVGNEVQKAVTKAFFQIPQGGY